MKRILSLLALVATVGFVLASCRAATYTAPLVPRFSPTASPVVVALATNTLGNTATITGSLKLKDLLGDTGYQIAITSVDLYNKTTNFGATLSGATTYSPVAVGNGNILRVSKSSNTINYEFSLSFTGTGNYATYATGSINDLTNGGRYAVRSAKYNVQLTTEDGNSTFVADDNSKLETTWSTSHN
ncbi:MAG: hypothetical protein J0L75_08555 [Spirochaetes bacterium]|nr:hypothetical protein [Spirochaetota bacterium]